LRPGLEPPLRARGLAWEDALPLFETVDSLDEIRAAVEDLDAFMKKLADAGGPAARKLILAKLRPRLEPPLAARGLQWEDALCVLEAPQALELVDTMEELRAAVEDPGGLLRRLADVGGPVARRLLLAQMRPQLEPPLRARGLA
jgi:hypothetical protein